MEILPTKDGVSEVHLSSWSEFAQLVANGFVRAPAYVYRGQADYDWSIVSSLDRLQQKYRKRKRLGGGAPEYFDKPPLTDEQHLGGLQPSNSRPPRP